jgi:hypothetical protein
MKASEAKRIASHWVEREASGSPGFHGAHLSGSLAALSEDEELPDFSDVDVYCVMDEASRFRQRKFRYDGVLLETVAYPLDAYSSPEAALSHPHLAHLFLHDGILADPDGFLRPIHQSVRERFAEPEWLRARYERAKAGALGVIEEASGAQTLDSGFAFLFRDLRLLSNLILIARLQAPTVRRSICAAKRLLRTTRYASLSEEFLELLGCARFTEEAVLFRLEECARAFDRAAAVYRTPIPPGFNLDPSVRPYLIEGANEMIRSGDFRESMLWIAAMHWTAYQALQNDAPEEEKSRWRASIDRLYEELGLRSLEDCRERLEAAKATAGRVTRFAEESVYPAPVESPIGKEVIADTPSKPSPGGR